jgi:hypothetical protein
LCPRIVISKIAASLRIKGNLGIIDTRPKIQRQGTESHFAFFVRGCKSAGREKDIILTQGKQKAAKSGLRCIYVSQRILNGRLFETALKEWGLP